LRPSSGITYLAPAALEQAIQEGLSQAVAVSRPVLTAHCEVAQRIGERLGLSEEIRRNLGQIYERWDGKGLPHGLKGDAVLPAVRLITLAQDAIALSDAGGVETMAEIIANRADGPYEAELAHVVSANAPALMEGIGATVDRETILALEPDPPVTRTHRPLILHGHRQREPDDHAGRRPQRAGRPP
jgi:hypothetical protein